MEDRVSDFGSKDDTLVPEGTDRSNKHRFSLVLIYLGGCPCASECLTTV
jgi:hypothetical protein